MIGKEGKLAEAEAGLGRAQQGAEASKQTHEVVCDRFLRDFERYVRLSLCVWVGSLNDRIAVIVTILDVVRIDPTPTGSSWRRPRS